MIKQVFKLSWIMYFILVSDIHLFAFGSLNTIYGYIEPITLLPWQLQLDAKLDTGAESASISAQDIHIHQLDNGEDFVFFRLVHPSLSQSYYYDLPLKGKAPIKNRAEEGKEAEYSYRPIVELPFCFDHQLYLLKVNLVDRAKFSYPLLIGRDVLIQFHADIDPDKSHTIAGC